MLRQFPTDQLLWLALTVLYCAITIVVVLRSRLSDNRYLIWLAAAILGVTALAVIFWPARAGTIGIVLWLLFLFVPSLIQRLLARAVAGYRLNQAQWLLRLLRWLHPFGSWRESQQLIRAFQFVQAGNDAAAEALLTTHPPDTASGRTMVLQLYRMQQRWPAVLTLTDDALTAPHFGRHSGDLSLLTMRLRALGETGALNDLVATFMTYQRLLVRIPWAVDQARLFVFAFCGREELAHLLLRQASLASWPASIKTYWAAVAACAAGARDQGRALLTELTNSDLEVSRRAAQAFLQRYSTSTPPPVAATVLSASARQQLAQIEQAYLQAVAAGATPIDGPRRTLVTYLLMAVNLAIFGLEVSRGALDNTGVLFDLGALAPAVVLWQGEWWRLLTSTFLHFSVTHIAFNLLALWFLGRLVESRLGAVRFLVVYLLAGVLSMGMYVVLLQLGWVSMYTLVAGASGSIMGLIGAEAALLLRLWRSDASQIARQHFWRALLFVLLQASMDLLIPQFSFTGHLSGAIFGFILANLLYRRQTLPYRSAPLPTPEPATPTE